MTNETRPEQCGRQKVANVTHMFIAASNCYHREWVGEHQHDCQFMHRRCLCASQKGRRDLPQPLEKRPKPLWRTQALNLVYVLGTRGSCEGQGVLSRLPSYC